MKVSHRLPNKNLPQKVSKHSSLSFMSEYHSLFIYFFSTFFFPLKLYLVQMSVNRLVVSWKGTTVFVSCFFVLFFLSPTSWKYKSNNRLLLLYPSLFHLSFHPFLLLKNRPPSLPWKRNLFSILLSLKESVSHLFDEKKKKTNTWCEWVSGSEERNAGKVRENEKRSEESEWSLWTSLTLLDSPITIVIFTVEPPLLSLSSPLKRGRKRGREREAGRIGREREAWEKVHSPVTCKLLFQFTKQQWLKMTRHSNNLFFLSPLFYTFFDWLITN